MLFTLIVLFIVLALVGAIPAWPRYGYYSFGPGLILVLILLWLIASGGTL